MWNLVRFGILNACGAMAVLFLGLAGYVAQVYASDPSYITVAITILFVAGLIASGYEMDRISRKLKNIPEECSDDLRYIRMSDNNVAYRRQVIADSMFSRVGYLHTLASLLTYLGLIGTIVGFIIAFSSIGDVSVETLTDTVASVVGGLKVAFYTTLLGAVTAAWTEINFRMIRTSTMEVLTKICRW